MIPRLVFIILIASCCANSRAEEAPTPSKPLDRVNRTIVKEPKYESQPKYSLLLLGSQGDTQVWMVEDGKRLFIDKNANGDLTDDGTPIQPSNVRQMDSVKRDFNYVLDAITPAKGSRFTEFDLRRWNYGEKEDSYGLSLSVNGQLPLYAGWFGTFWSTKPETAPVLPLGGPFTPCLLERKSIKIAPGKQTVSLGFFNSSFGKGPETRLSIEALPRYLVPKLKIEWPVAAGQPPLQTTHKLEERCCYWAYYTNDFVVPEGAVIGKARVSVDFPAGPVPIELATSELDVPVIAASNDPVPGR